jgi:LAS superfamily LD-carboxypeptidase LdcB
MLNELELTGRVRTHVVQRDELGAAVHAAVLEPFLAMQAAARHDGIEIEIVSAFRDFAAQERIWNLKWAGQRPLYDAEGNVRDHAALAPAEIVEAILCWSALPGASRHHWGSEIDVIDRAAIAPDYRVQLLPSEVARGGVFHPLHCWLDRNMDRFGFFRPYRTFRGGVRPEAWHLSYASVSMVCVQALTPEMLADALRGSELLGKELVLARIDDLHARYVANVDGPDDAGTRTLA